MVYTKNVGFKTKVGYTKSRAGRTFTKGKKKAPLTKTETKAVASIAKKVMNKNVEHKYIVKGLEDTALLCSNIYAFNPMGNVVYGTGTDNRIGEQINNVVLRVKLAYSNIGQKVDIPTYLKLWNQSRLRIMVIKTKRQLTNVSNVWTDITTLIGRTDSAAARDSCIFYQPTGWAYPYHSGMSDVRKDNDFKVLYDKYITSAGNQDSQTIAGNIQNGFFKDARFSVPLGRFEYEEANVAYARKGFNNIYVLVCPWIPRTVAGIDIAGDITCHYSLSWTDS